MVYVYDLVLNWSNKYRYEFFEWNNNDEIEYIKKIPVLKIDNFNEVVAYNYKVDNNFLNKILNKTEVYNNKIINKVEYCCIFCNSSLTNAVACEYDSEGFLLYSSNIYFLDLEDVFDLVRKEKAFRVDGNVVNKKIGDSYNYYLTRKEKMRKKLLLDNINFSYLNKEFDKLKYFYYEIFNRECNDVEVIKRSLDNSINSFYNDKHEQLYNVIKLTL